MFDSSIGEGWCKLLFNAMSIPFVILLAVLLTSQVMTARDHAEDPGNAPGELAGDVLF